MAWAYRNMIVADAIVDTCRSLAMLLAGEGQKLWTTPLSADGKEPATHWISSGLIEEQFADLMPLSEWTWVVDDEEMGTGHWEETVISPGNPSLLAELSGGAVTEEQVQAIFSMCDVTLEEPQQALSRLGLQMVQPEEVM